MTGWIDKSTLGIVLNDKARRALGPVLATQFPKGTALFHPGDAVRGFAIVLSGRVGVYLAGPSGRDILLYDIVPGQTCVQSTLGILGGELYSAQAMCETDCELAMIPKDIFQNLLNSHADFREFVFGAFAKRMQSMMQVLEQVAFVKVEIRLAAALLARKNDNNTVHATHQDLATQVGTAREVVSRRLDAMSKLGLIQLERGAVQILKLNALKHFAAKI